MSDDEILAGIRTGGRARENATEFLLDTHIGMVRNFHRKYPMVANAKIKDIFVDSILSVIANVSGGKYRKSGKLAAYLYNIMANKCKDLSRSELSKTAKIKKEMEVKDYDKERWVASKAPNQEQNMILMEQIRRFREISSSKGSNCWKILELSFIKGYKMKEVADMLGLASGDSARVQKFKCLAKLKQSLL